MRFIGLSPAQDRALHELSQGRALCLVGEDLPEPLLCWSIDRARDLKLHPGGYAILTRQRAEALGLKVAEGQNALLAVPIEANGSVAQLRFITQSNTQMQVPTQPAPAFAADLVALAKQGRLIPALYLHRAPADIVTSDTLRIDVAALPLTDQVEQIQRISRVPLPMEIAGRTLTTQATLYSLGTGGRNPVALTLGDTQSVAAPLVRLHSACLTGDVFGSLRCDCGPQLHQALLTMDSAGQGCLLYLPQEGRDTGLKNKLRAYALQDAGLDTIEADAALGFEADERDFAMAAALLKDLGLSQIRLMTNNPQKVDGLETEGIEVVERVPLQIRPQAHNQAYLETKAQKAGHDL